MKEILLQWLLDNYQIIFLCIALIVITAIIITLGCKFYYTRYKKTEDKVNELPCAMHSDEIATAKTKTERIEENIIKLPCDSYKEGITDLKAVTSKLETNVTTILNKMDTVGEQLAEISRWIMKTDPIEIDRIAPKFSPRRLSAAGIELYTISGAKKIVDDNEDLLVEDIHKMNPITPLDVEDDSYAVLMKRMSEPMFNDVKNYIYYQPEMITVKDENGDDVTVKLSLPLLVRLMSIDLRDRYLNRHPINPQ